MAFIMAVISGAVASQVVYLNTGSLALMGLTAFCTSFIVSAVLSK